MSKGAAKFTKTVRAKREALAQREENMLRAERNAQRPTPNAQRPRKEEAGGE
jgi:hypothetical protein